MVGEAVFAWTGSPGNDEKEQGLSCILEAGLAGLAWYWHIGGTKGAFQGA